MFSVSPVLVSVTVEELSFRSYCLALIVYTFLVRDEVFYVSETTVNNMRSYVVICQIEEQFAGAEGGSVRAGVVLKKCVSLRW